MNETLFKCNCGYQPPQKYRKMITEQEANEVAIQASNNINEGTADTFRSYDEGVKDTIDWIFFGGAKPDLVSE